MANNTDDKNKQNTQDSDGSDKKLLAGKYEKTEDLEKGYEEAVRKMHDATKEAAHWKESFETFSRGDADTSTYTGSDVEESEQALVEAITTNPKAVLQEFGRGLTEKIVGDVKKILDTRDTVKVFLDANKDLRDASGLFGSMLTRTNPKLSVSDRLNNAAELTRSEINAIKERGKKQQEFEDKQKRQAADTDSEGNDAPRGKPKGKDNKKEDYSYESYMKERKDRAAKLGGLI